jgi:VIT1/CCC1 family predicted Fe2+/Mn2+ transporter
MFLSFVMGAAVPLAPLALRGGSSTLLLSWALSVPLLLGVGILKGMLTGRPRLRSGLEFAAVALGSALVGWLVGTLFEWAFGICRALAPGASAGDPRTAATAPRRG